MLKLKRIRNRKFYCDINCKYVQNFAQKLELQKCLPEVGSVVVVVEIFFLRLLTPLEWKLMSCSHVKSWVNLLTWHLVG